MPEADYITAATLDQVGENRIFCTEAKGHGVLLCQVAGKYYAVENRCSHAESTFDKGRLRGHKLLCPLHGGIFDVRDGKVLGPPAYNPIRTFPVRVVGSEIQVCIAVEAEPGKTTIY